MRYPLSLLASLLLVINSFAQESDLSTIQKSTDKVKLEGKYYYIHIVRKGETLYSISRAYNVSQIEIAMENQDIYLGIQPDQALKIPIREGSVELSDVTRDDEYIYHVVRRGETLYGLTRKYQISIEEIVKVNPEVSEGIKLSQVVLIPQKRRDENPMSAQQESDRFYYHEVKPREGFFSLERKYGVNEETIRRLNPELVKDGLKLGTVLRIPKDPNETLSVADDSYSIAQQDFSEFDGSQQPTSAHCDSFEYKIGEQSFNVALILPFNVESTEPSETETGDISSSGNSSSIPNPRTQQSTQNYIEFYQGALLALHALKQMGLSVNLWVYDSKKDVGIVKELIKDKGIEEADLIIGPVFPETLKPMADFAREHRIPLVSPLSPNNYLLNNNPYIFQANPSFTTQLEEFTSKIDPCGGKNLLILHEGDSTNVSLINNFKSLLKSRISSCPNASSIHFKEVTYRAGSPAPSIIENISHSLTQDRENMILVPSNNEVFVTDLLGNLFTLYSYHGYPISLYGFPRWQRFRNVQIEYYYQLQLHLFTPFFVNYSQPLVQQFIGQYRSNFRTEPSQFAFQGYDVLYFFLSAMKEYGLDFQYCLQNHRPGLLQSEFRFMQLNQISGYENRAINMIQYTKNFDIIQAP